MYSFVDSRETARARSTSAHGFQGCTYCGLVSFESSFKILI